MLALAAALRLYELPAEILSHDEAVVANIATGTVLEILRDTGQHSSSPILYPLLLSVVVQTVDASPLAVRLLPATASILTVAALLLWLPRVGIARGAALLAGLMATLCGELIRHAQDVREYSLDTLVATLMLIGLLKCLRGGGGALLCVTLAIAPLTQYGLALFGLAVLATLALSHRTHLGDTAPPRLSKWRERLHHLARPAGCFALGVGTTYALTLHTQGLNAVALGRYGAVVQSQAYRGNLADLGAMIEFSATKLLAFANHFAPTVVMAIGGCALAALLARSIAKRRALAPVPMLFLLAGATSLAAALLSLYPLGPHRQCMYLAPVFFVGLAHAIHDASCHLPAPLRRASATMVAVAALTQGGVAVAGDFPYQERGKSAPVLAALDAHLGDDLLYLPETAAPIMDFYYPERGDQFYRTNVCGWGSNERCQQGFVKQLRDLHLDGAERIWLVFFNYHAWPIVWQWRDEGLAEHILGTGFANLFLVPNVRSVVSPLLHDLESHAAAAPREAGRRVGMNDAHTPR